ncbi:MAG: CTP synthase [Planctomycetes bacterium]|nr:CTP synthase [Planctomycetota bacterium]
MPQSQDSSGQERPLGPAPSSPRAPEEEFEDGGCVSPLLAAAARTSVDTEFYSPIPDGYRFGRHKYLVVLGTVISGLGKGIFSSSLAKLLKDKGLVVAPMKMEGYLNIDAGTLNPFRHGEVFVLDDGTECDMDLGTYERMLDQNLSKRNFVTSGQIFRDILDRERHGGYLGRDVQMIPHVTGDVKRRLRELAMHGDGQRPADIVFVEVGGTVGDYENGFYIEALRELAFEEGPNSVCFVALTYIVEPGSLGEQKSKAAQLGIKRVMEAGIQPHIIACRSANPCTSTVLQKIAMFTNVAQKRVFSMHDRKSVYEIPDAMRQEGLDREVLSILSLHDRVDLAQEDRHRERWVSYVRKMQANRTKKVKIGITGKYAGLRDAYASIDKAVEHCSTHLGCDAELEWISATDVTDDNARSLLGHLDAVIVPGGFGARGVEGKISCVRYCRESRVPYLGICLGFQVAVIEFARNVMGLRDANSTEFDSHCPQPVISELPEQKRIEKLGGSMRLGGQMVQITPGTLAYEMYRHRETIRERFRHRYEVDPGYVERLEAAGLIFSGRHPVYPIMQVLELPRSEQDARHAGDKPAITHPFFFAAQCHPELTGRPLRPQPMFMGLVSAAIKRKHPEHDPLRWVKESASAEVG